jgi:hypothetical protein
MPWTAGPSPCRAASRPGETRDLLTRANGGRWRPDRGPPQKHLLPPVVGAPRADRPAPAAVEDPPGVADGSDPRPQRPGPFADGYGFDSLKGDERCLLGTLPELGAKLAHVLTLLTRGDIGQMKWITACFFLQLVVELAQGAQEARPNTALAPHPASGRCPRWDLPLPAHRLGRPRLRPAHARRVNGGPRHLSPCLALTACRSTCCRPRWPGRQRPDGAAGWTTCRRQARGYRG